MDDPKQHLSDLGSLLRLEEAAKKRLKVLRKEIEEVNKPKAPFLLSVVPGGKEPPPADNWLDELEIGTAFIAKKKGDPMQWVMPKFVILGRGEKTTFLATATDPMEIPVDPNAFCNVFRLFENLGVFFTKEDLDEHKRNRVRRNKSSDKDDKLVGPFGEQTEF